MASPSLLSADEESALKGLYRQVYGRHAIRDQCQKQLVAYDAGRGENLAALPLIPDVTDPDAWEEEWRLRAALSLMPPLVVLLLWFGRRAI